jgi:hypothetical protein
MVAERIAVEDRIECHDEGGRRRVVLRWRRFQDDGDGWTPVGPALFTLADASALIQIGGSTLQVVGTGERLEVIDPSERDVPVLNDAMPAALAAASGVPAWTH